MRRGRVVRAGGRQTNDNDTERAPTTESCLPDGFEPYVGSGGVLGKGTFGRVYVACRGGVCPYAAKWIALGPQSNLTEKENREISDPPWIEKSAKREIRFLTVLQDKFRNSGQRFTPWFYGARKCEGTGGMDKAIVLVMELFDSDALKLFRSVKTRTFINEEHLLQMFTIIRMMNELYIVHGDLKPDQFFYNKKYDRLVLSDFGFSGFQYAGQDKKLNRHAPKVTPFRSATLAVPKTPSRAAIRKASKGRKNSRGRDMLVPYSGWSEETICDPERGTGSIKRKSPLYAALPFYNFLQLENYLLRETRWNLYIHMKTGEDKRFVGLDDSLVPERIRTLYSRLCDAFDDYDKERREVVRRYGSPNGYLLRSTDIPLRLPDMPFPVA